MSPLTSLHALVWIVIVVIGTATAVGLVFDPRFIDFPFAPLTMAVVPFAAMTLLNPTGKDVHPLAETIFAGVFRGSRHLRRRQRRPGELAISVDLRRLSPAGAHLVARARLRRAAFRLALAPGIDHASRLSPLTTE